MAGFVARGPIDLTEWENLSFWMAVSVSSLFSSLFVCSSVPLNPILSASLRNLTAASVSLNTSVVLSLSASAILKNTPPRVCSPAGKWLPYRSIKVRADFSLSNALGFLSWTIDLAFFSAVKERRNWCGSIRKTFLAMRMYCRTDALVLEVFADWETWLLSSWLFSFCTSPTKNSSKPATPKPMLVLVDSTVRT